MQTEKTGQNQPTEYINKWKVKTQGLVILQLSSHHGYLWFLRQAGNKSFTRALLGTSAGDWNTVRKVQRGWGRSGETAGGAAGSAGRGGW